MSQPPFKVIIVGGSITGLTLAHSLHKIGVDFIVLEKRGSVTPQEGASVGILPNGARVLEQLGLYAVIEQVTAPLGATHIHFPDAVSEIEQHNETKSAGVRVRTINGEVYEADLVVGADGVHSRTRSEMWRMACPSGETEDVKSEKDSKRWFFIIHFLQDARMSAEYSCVFGISRGASGLKEGEQVMRIYDGRTLVVIPSKDDVVFWFLARKLDRKYKYSEAPRFTLEDAAAECSELADAPLGGGVHFQDVWRMRQTFNMVVLEENLLQTWSSGRVLCIGDSIHKVIIPFLPCLVDETSISRSYILITMF
ncbi:FAD-dependent monooxygenase ctvC [Colletotrichum spaethianum]|uniref:FAD-dependent monooxygenase ctvC n=1 Tax=Colletotrichum spaethianum TaxID=700344 RepID=A0AA37LHZ9_9PEZI|nr:FAD-dependent monooxygenase ctvC [Colletotrichum spaethianum]GKT46893.1 FAD-dependent monooxygenase ctvC [Colletotrichum spaethianum]